MNNITDPKTFLEDYTREMIGDPEHRVQIMAGYIKHLEARDRAFQVAEVKMAIATFKEDPEIFLEVAESRLAELKDFKTTEDTTIGEG